MSALALTVFLLLAAGSSDTNRSTTSSSSAPMSDNAPSRSPAEDVRTTAAMLFTSRYERSELGSWRIRADAAGADCGVLLVTIGRDMDDSMIEAFHYSSAVYEGGVDHFYRERTFRGVAYRDASGQRWKYGLVGEDEVRVLSPC